jgi:heme/copper-type cytochrome/quinol oxidase subunit 2
MIVIDQVASGRQSTQAVREDSPANTSIVIIVIIIIIIIIIINIIISFNTVGFLKSNEQNRTRNILVMENFKIKRIYRVSQNSRIPNSERCRGSLQ